MNATTVAVDLAKNVFQVALADVNIGVHRAAPPDARPVRALLRQPPGRARGHGSLRLGAPLGATVRRPRHRGASCCRRSYVRAYVERNKTDAADAKALLEAAALRRHRAVRVTSRSSSKPAGTASHPLAVDGTRTSRINALRGFCREFGLHVPVGARTGVEADRPRGGRRSICDSRHCCARLMRLLARGDPACSRRASLRLERAARHRGARESNGLQAAA